MSELVKPTPEQLEAFRAVPLEERLRQLAEVRSRMTPEDLDKFGLVLQPTTEGIEKDWQSWYGEMFRDDPYGKFTDWLDSKETNDRHHSEALGWHWQARNALLRGERPENDWFAYFPIWARANMKTTIARRMLLCDACVSVSQRKPGYSLIVGGTKNKVRKTADTLHQMLASPKIQQYYPGMARAVRNKKGTIVGWRVDYIQTEAGHIFEFVALEEGMAGANVSDQRISFLLLDDVDDREDSPVIAEKNFNLVTREILPMGQANTLVFFAQNLISRYSVMHQIQSQRQRVLTNRKPTRPIPAARDLVTEPRTVNGIVKDVVVSCRPTWKAWDTQRVQDEINKMGLPAFLREMQHEVEQDREGLVLQHWNDAVHVITWRHFNKLFGLPEDNRAMPRAWPKYNSHDWSRTKTKFHANVDVTIAVSAQNSALPGAYFVFNPWSFLAGCSPEDVALQILTGISPTVKLMDGGSAMTWSALFQSILKRTEMESHQLSLTQLIEARRSTFAQIIPRYVEPILKAQNYVAFRGSHEQSKTGALEVYQRVFGLPFHGVNPGMDGGVGFLNLAQKVDYSADHPFKEGMKGYTRWFLVIDEDPNTQDVPEYLDALSPDDLHNANLFRYQMRNWRFRDPYLTSKGEMEGEILKLNDDYGSALMMLFFDNLLQAAPLTHDEMVEVTIAPGFTHAELAKRTDISMEVKCLNALFARAFAEGALNDQPKEYDDYGFEIPQKKRPWGRLPTLPPELL